MSAKAEYRSSLRSKKLIREAFFALLSEKNKTKITVTDIVNRADINRRTFYAHYQDIRALLAQYEDEVITKIGEFIQEGKVTGPSQDPLPLISKMTEYIDENLDCFRMLLCGDDAELFAGKLKELFMENLNDENMIPADIRSSIEFCILMHYVAGGLVNVIQMLLRSDTGHPLSEYSKGLANLIRIPKRVGRTIIGELFGSITTTKNALHHTTS